MPHLPNPTTKADLPFSLVEGVRPIVILGAARSGTKFLRQLLSASQACNSVPHGVNHVWRYGNESHPHDALSSTQYSERTARHIRRTLARIGGLNSDASAHYLVEKTCANTLRVPYVRRVLPDARFIHIVRDGRDVAVSARRQWQRPPSLLAQFKKILAAPIMGLRSGMQHLIERINPSRTNRTSTPWGPQYPGIDVAATTLSTLEICAQQWKHCVEACLDGLASVPTHRCLTIHYETLVTSTAIIDELSTFLDLPDPEIVRAHYHRTVRHDTVGRWKETLEPHEQAVLNTCLESTLRRLGYLS